MVTKKTVPSHSWSKQKQNISLDYQHMDTNAIAVIGAVSREKGLELVMTWPKSITKIRFKIFLEELRRINQFDDIILVADNLSFHKIKDTREGMDELGFRYSWIPRYSP